uniref:Uncharacterized protein n=1 Tax=Rhizophora mucronata TaxID=61149 RepID=A0A2P2J5T1_RHIMU
MLCFPIALNKRCQNKYIRLKACFHHLIQCVLCLRHFPTA